MAVEALKLNDSQKGFLAEHGIVFDYDAMSDDDFCDLEDQVGDLLTFEGIDENEDENEIGGKCYEILEILANLPESE
jgi:hypothetical protein